MKFCRACLSTAEVNNMVLMDISALNHFNVLTNLDIVLEDDTQFYLCVECDNAIKFCINFREKCITSDLTLRNLNDTLHIEDIETDNDIVLIKEEVKEEYTDYEYYEESTFDTEEYLQLSEDKAWIPALSQKEVTTAKRSSERLKKRPLKESNKLQDEWLPKKPKGLIKTEKVLKKLPKPIKTVKRKIKPGPKKGIIHINHKPGNPFQCGLCSEAFGEKIELTQHLEKHKIGDNCEFCDEEFMTQAHILGHRWKHVLSKICLMCPRKFMSALTLEFHYMREHNMAAKDEPLCCKRCPSRYGTPRQLQRHLWAAHTHPLRFFCKYCGKGYRHENQLVNHLPKHTGEKRFKCSDCDFTCKFSTGILEHRVRRHTPGRLTCDKCMRVFANAAKLAAHTCHHSTLCPVCGRSFKTSKLQRHMKTHENVYSYKCELCPNQYKSQSSYQAHMNKHNNFRKHLCPYCPMGFFSKTVLRKHKMTHTGQKPYVCTLCEKGFTANHNLKVHMKVHGLDVFAKKAPPETEDDTE